MLYWVQVSDEDFKRTLLERSEAQDLALRFQAPRRNQVLREEQRHLNKRNPTVGVIERHKP